MDNTPKAVRRRLLDELLPIAHRLPNGLLQRLVEDARFFEEWQKGKRGMRGSGRMEQAKKRVEKAEERAWKKIPREGSSRIR